MLKAIISIVMFLVFSAYASFGIAWQLEAVSLKRARRDEGVERRSLELGIKGRVIFTLIFSVLFIFVMILSNIKILSMILGLLLSALWVTANVKLRQGGIKIAPQLFALWIATMISSVTYAHMNTKDVLGVIYTILQVLCLIGILVSTFVVKEQKDEDDEDNDDPEEKLRRELFLKIFLAIGIIAVAVVLFVVMEVQFDFLPPYRF